MAAATSKWISNRRLNSLTALAQPTYQRAHGPRTVGTWVRKSKALSTPVCCRRAGQDRKEAPLKPTACCSPTAAFVCTLQLRLRPLPDCQGNVAVGHVLAVDRPGVTLHISGGAVEKVLR